MVSPSTRFRTLLKEAEHRFGPRSRKIRIKVEPRSDQVPETILNATNDGATVYYARVAKDDPLRLRFQLAHEAIHCLSGAFRRDALVLEEGLAVYFTLNLTNKNSSYDQRATDALPPLFNNALALFNRLNPTDEKIKALRTHYPCLDAVQPEILQSVFGATNGLVNELCDRVPNEMHMRL
jgi:hypothetical protein